MTEVAREDRVARHLRLPGGVQRPRGAGQVRSAADTASARRDDKAGLRILVAQDHLEAPKQFGLSPGVDDDAVLDVDTNVEIALDAADGKVRQEMQAAAQGNSHMPPFPGGQALLKVTTWSTSARIPIHSPTVWL